MAHRLHGVIDLTKTLQCDRASSRQGRARGIGRLTEEINVTFDATANPSHARGEANPALMAALAITAIAAATLAGALFFQLVLGIPPRPPRPPPRHPFCLSGPPSPLTPTPSAPDPP